MPNHPRVIENKITEHLKLFPVVGVSRSRQSGRSTVSKKLVGAKLPYVAFDHLNQVDRFHSNRGVMGVDSERVIFDEVHRSGVPYAHAI